jgi:phosphoribosylanthranilate isomerase
MTTRPQQEPAFLVKVCGVTTEEDAQAAVEAGASALGFNFYPRSPRYLSLERAQQIARALPAHVVRAGVFVSPTAEQLYAYAKAMPLDAVQIHGETPLLDRQQLKETQVWRAIPVDARFEAEQVNKLEAEAFLFDAPTSGFGGSGQTFEWSRIQGMTQRILVAGGLDDSNVAAAIHTVKPWGVDACSRIESAPGRKDLQKMRRFVAAALQAFETEVSAAL